MQRSLTIMHGIKNKRNGKMFKISYKRVNFALKKKMISPKLISQCQGIKYLA